MKLRHLLFSINHKIIGVLYLSFSLFAGIFGLIFLKCIKFGLFPPGWMFFNCYCKLYYTPIAIHIFMLVFFIIIQAIIFGLISFYLPLIISSRNMYFPRLNNLSF